MREGEYAIYTIHIVGVQPMTHNISNIRAALAGMIGSASYIREDGDNLVIDRLPTIWRGPAVEAEWRRQLRMAVQNASVQTYGRVVAGRPMAIAVDARPCQVYALAWRWRPAKEGGPAWRGVN